MKTMFLAAAVASTLGMSSAFAQSDASASGYVYPNFWGNQAAQTSTKGQAATQLSGDPISAYVTRTDHNGTWLFPPNPNNGG